MLFKNKTKKKELNEKIAGNLRQGQLLNTYGVGSIVDFVDDTVMIAGTDEWKDEENLRLYNESLQGLTGADYFLMPKPAEDMQWKKSKDIPAYIFPEILYCSNCGRLFHYYDLKRTNKDYKCLKCNKSLVASRFVLVCENGHIQDFPYEWWVHRGVICEPKGKKHELTMFNINNRADMDSLLVRCEDCGTTRRMREALGDNALSGFRCKKNFPHLADPKRYSGCGCDEMVKTRLRLSNSIYFPVLQSALTIPPWSRKTYQLIMKKYNEISHAMDPAAFIKDCIEPNDKNITLEMLLDAYNYLRIYKSKHTEETMTSIMFEEYLALNKGTIKNADDYESRTVSIPDTYTEVIDKVVAIDKLTVISALCGFTRLTPWSGASLKDGRIAPLSMEKKRWLPGIKMIGEGIFIRFRDEKLSEWEAYVKARYNKMETAYKKSYIEEQRFSPRFVFLHTFSHLLIRQLAAECGYNAASMKERIYSTFVKGSSNNMSGVLIYLASTDSDGSLGGLVSVAENKELLERVLDNMLKNSLWCSGDPVCINAEEQGVDSLNYSACHDCVLLPEVSCECRNVFLDRVSVVGKPDNRSLGVLGQIAENVGL